MIQFLTQVSDARRTVEDALGVVQAVVEYAGTVAFAISAALLAARRRMTFVGVVVFGVLVAIGGGTIRDVLLGNLPVYWVDEPMPLIVAAVAAAATIPLVNLGTMSLLAGYDLVRVFDAAGLALFTVLGTNIALDAGAGPVSAVFVGTIAGMGGGILRDTIAEKIPVALASGHFYGSAAVTGAAMNVALLETSMSPTIVSALAAGLIFVLRMASIHFEWGEPKLEIDDAVDGPSTA